MNMKNNVICQEHTMATWAVWEDCENSKEFTRSNQVPAFIILFLKKLFTETVIMNFHMI